MRRRPWCTRADRVFQFLKIVNGAGSSRAVLFWKAIFGFRKKIMPVRALDGGVAMRRLVLAAVMFGAVSGAQAADMPDFLRGSLPAGPAPTVNWQGYYIGGQAGYGSSDENFNGSTSNMIAALLANTT